MTSTSGGGSRWFGTGHNLVVGGSHRAIGRTEASGISQQVSQMPVISGLKLVLDYDEAIRAGFMRDDVASKIADWHFCLR